MSFLLFLSFFFLSFFDLCFLCLSFFVLCFLCFRSGSLSLLLSLLSPLLESTYDDDDDDGDLSRLRLPLSGVDTQNVTHAGVSLKSHAARTLCLYGTGS